jgi:hypothetical protein
MTSMIRQGLLALLLVFLTTGSRAQSSIDSTLQSVESLYSAGSYAQAELEGRRLLEHELLNDSVRVTAEQWVAFSLVAQGRPALAKEHFLNILRRKPSYEPDPILTSPKILTVFNEARAAFRSAPPQQAGGTSTQENALPASGVTFRTIVFPGWEQLYHGRTAAGTAFLAGGIATLGTGITLEFMRSAAHKDYLAATTPEEIESTYNTYNRISKAEMWAFAAFAAVYVASEIDVFLNSAPVSLSVRSADPANPATGYLLTLSIRQ